MWQPKQPASDAVATLGFAMVCPPHLLPLPLLAASMSEPMGLWSYSRLPIGHREADALLEDARRPGRRSAALSVTSMSVSASRAVGVDADLLVRAAADEPEDVLAVQLPRGADAAGAQDAAVAVDEDVRVRGVDLALREQVRVLRRGDAEPVGQGLQLAVAALLAEHAEVVALDEQHLDDVLAACA